MAETKVGSAFVDLKVKDDKFNSDMNKAGGRLKKFGASAGRFALGAAKVVGIGLAVTAAASVRALAKQEEAEAKLEQVLRATGNAAGFTADQLKKEAAELQSLTKFGDEAVMETQALLATFREIKGENFKEATGLALDMATLFGDARSATIQIGKALNDPIKGVTALTRVGVTFTDQQKAQIRNYQEMGDITSAQGVILAELQNQFGGVAAAAADTIGGRFEQLKNSLGDTLEVIGGLFTGGEGGGGVADMLLVFRLRVDELNESLDKMISKSNPVSNFFGKFKRGIEGASAFFGALSAGDSISQAFEQAKTIPDILAKERQEKLAEAKAASDRAKGMSGVFSGVDLGGQDTQLKKQNKSSFHSFQGAIKNTQNNQAKKDNQKKIDLAQKQLKTQKDQLTELIRLNEGAGAAQPIVTE